ncbi:MAG: hypothetical protein K0Q66_430 [Chitinophagaceae bacterium]|jgi:hypothetical protein|nr:hypothetical protein [Chitinophagaceae bacterium]
MLNRLPVKLFSLCAFVCLLSAKPVEQASTNGQENSKTFSCATALDLYAENTSTTIPVWVTYTSDCDVKGFKVSPSDAKSGYLGYNQDVEVRIHFPWGANPGRIKIVNGGVQVACITVVSSWDTYYFTVNNAVGDGILVTYLDGATGC